MNTQDGQEAAPDSHRAGGPRYTLPPQLPRQSQQSGEKTGGNHAARRTAPPLIPPHIPDGNLDDEPCVTAATDTVAATETAAAPVRPSPREIPPDMPHLVWPDWMGELHKAARHAGMGVRWCRRNPAIVIPWMAALFFFFVAQGQYQKRVVAESSHAKAVAEFEKSALDAAVESVRWSLQAAEYERTLRRVRMRLMGIPAGGWTQPPWDPPNIAKVISDSLGDGIERDLENAEMLAPGIERQVVNVDRGLRSVRPDLPRPLRR